MTYTELQHAAEHTAFEAGEAQARLDNAQLSLEHAQEEAASLYEEARKAKAALDAYEPATRDEDEPEEDDGF